MATVHIAGAGVAGLACAVRLALAGRRIALYEAAPQAGGRCRSFFDRTLGRTIDNGNHLLLSANRAALAYLAEIGAADSLIGPARAAFPFVDLASGRRWTVRPNAGPVPWWIFSRSRRLPGTRPADYLSGLKLARAGAAATVAECVAPDHPLYRPFWEPLTLAALNCAPGEAAARPLWAVLAETFARGEAWCRPLIARKGLGASLVDPALALLARHGAPVRCGARLRGIEIAAGRAAALAFGDATVPLGPDDLVVLAVPPGLAAELLPGLTVPEEGRPIVNAHFRLDRPVALPEGIPVLGLLGGTAHWLFFRDDMVSITVSAADAVVDRPAEALAALLWSDTARALGLPAAPVPPVRIIKERRATFTQTPANIARRPPARTAWPNVILAGDWTATGLPATIEGAIRSGHKAAAVARG